MSSTNSQQTREKILKAAWKLLEQKAGQKTRMVDIAKEAGVSRQAVYLHFPSRADLLIATTQYIDTVEDVASRLATVKEADGGLQRLHAFVYAWGNYIPVICKVARTLLALKDSDNDAVTAWEDRMVLLRGICRSIVEELATEKILSKHMSVNEAADIMWSMLSVQFWELLTIDRGFKQDRYLELMEKMLLDVITEEKVH